jgi:starvation-inducible DNA-binding protein
MEELLNKLRLLQSNAFIYYTKAHGYHWDVEGILFEQFHSMFGDLYQDVWESIDEYAEWLRRLGVKASFDVMSALSNSNIKYDLSPDASNPVIMIQSLLNSNSIMINDLKEAFPIATAANEEGAANYIAERIDAHQKWGWKLSASLKSMVNN